MWIDAAGNVHQGGRPQRLDPVEPEQEQEQAQWGRMRDREDVNTDPNLPLACKILGWPSFRVKSLVAVLCALQVLVFIVTALQSAMVDDIPGMVPLVQWLQASHSAIYAGCSQSMFKNIGVNGRMNLGPFELRRLLTPILLTIFDGPGSILNLFFTIYWECTFGSRLELQEGHLWFAMVYFGGGAFGVLSHLALYGTLPIVISDWPFIISLFGAECGNLFVIWNGLDTGKRMMATKIISLEAIQFMLIMSSSLEWIYPALGGFFGGFCMYWGLSKRNGRYSFAAATAFLLFWLFIMPRIPGMKEMFGYHYRIYEEVRQGKSLIKL